MRLEWQSCLKTDQSFGWGWCLKNVLMAQINDAPKASWTHRFTYWYAIWFLRNASRPRLLVLMHRVAREDLENCHTLDAIFLSANRVARSLVWFPAPLGARVDFVNFVTLSNFLKTATVLHSLTSACAGRRFLLIAAPVRWACCVRFRNQIHFQSDSRGPCQFCQLCQLGVVC